MDVALDLPLPPLREDLQLSEAAPTRSGEPAWVIQDVVVNRFYRIGWLEFEFLLRWGHSPREIADAVNAETPLDTDAEQVNGFRQFLEANHLLRPTSAMVERLRTRSEGQQWLNWNWWLHHYLFFRIPLVRPQRFLQWLARHTDWLFHRVTAFAVIALSVLGIVLVGRQWDEFRSAVIDAFSFEGIIGFALAMIIGKTLHELGHALVATRLGVRVAHMGVAFVVMWPMLYTDTGEAWKLRSSRQRLAIASAGVLTELALAGLSTLFWTITEPGTLRHTWLYLATTSWVLTLALNASPFTRFDGYFILSDLLDFPNLHERSSAMARVFLRRHLLGLPEPWPEPMDHRLRRSLIAFAFTTWIYRFALFLGIAVAVYYLFFKALGIVLFVVEVSWFIALPIVRELRHWWNNRALVARRRRWVFGALGLLAIALLAIPWRTEVHAYGVARAAKQQHVFAPFPALIRSIAPPGPVAAGAELVVLEQPDIALHMRGSESSLRGYQAQLTGLLAVPGGIDAQTATRERLQVQFEEVRSAREEMARLVLRAPFAGQWGDVDPDWKAGQWVRSSEPLGIMIDPGAWQVDAYVSQEQVYRLREGSPVRFYADGEPSPLSGKLIAVDTTRSAQLDHAMLSSRFGGPITTSKKGDNLAPTPPVFRVVVALDAPPLGGRETRGHVQIEGERASFLVQTFTRIYAALVKQSGF